MSYNLLFNNKEIFLGEIFDGIPGRLSQFKRKKNRGMTETDIEKIPEKGIINVWISVAFHGIIEKMLTIFNMVNYMLSYTSEMV